MLYIPMIVSYMAVKAAFEAGVSSLYFPMMAGNSFLTGISKPAQQSAQST